MKILTFLTHEGYQWNLAKTKHQFDILISDRLGGIKDWDLTQRPKPDNCKIIDKIQNTNSYDLILCQKQEDFELVRNIQKPKVILFHCIWSRNWKISEEQDIKNRENFFNSIKDCYKVFINDYKKKSWGCDDEKTFVIYHGLDINEYTSYKGTHELVLRVCHYIRNRDWWCGYRTHLDVMGDDNRYVIVGKNPETPKATESKDWNDLKNYYKNCRVYLNTTINDLYPLGMLEAMSSGMPVVTTYIEGEMNIIQNGISGCYSNDPKVLKIYVKRMMDNLSFASKVGKNGQQLINSYFNINTFINKWDKVFEEVAV